MYISTQVIVFPNVESLNSISISLAHNIIYHNCLINPDEAKTLGNKILFFNYF